MIAIAAMILALATNELPATCYDEPPADIDYTARTPLEHELVKSLTCTHARTEELEIDLRACRDAYATSIPVLPAPMMDARDWTAEPDTDFWHDFGLFGAGALVGAAVLGGTILVVNAM